MRRLVINFVMLDILRNTNAHPYKHTHKERFSFSLQLRQKRAAPEHLSPEHGCKQLRPSVQDTSYWAALTPSFLFFNNSHQCKCSYHHCVKMWGFCCRLGSICLLIVVNRSDRYVDFCVYKLDLKFTGDEMLTIPFYGFAMNYICNYHGQIFHACRETNLVRKKWDNIDGFSIGSPIYTMIHLLVNFNSI